MGAIGYAIDFIGDNWRLGALRRGSAATVLAWGRGEWKRKGKDLTQRAQRKESTEFAEKRKSGRGIKKTDLKTGHYEKGVARVTRKGDWEYCNSRQKLARVSRGTE